MNTRYVLNRKVMEVLGVTDDDIEEISMMLPERVEEAYTQFNFSVL